MDEKNTSSDIKTSIIKRVIEDEMKQSYLDYSMSVIVSRALPDVRDGLKPVHRRILYAMHDMGITAGKAHKKCARIVGEVLGKYHPHGDTAVYDSLVRMAQNFSLRYMLVDGHGNFGSIDGDRQAAMRYCITADSLVVTEKGLQRIGELSQNEHIDLKILSKDKIVNAASRWFDSGDHPTKKLTTSKGYSLTGSYNHPVLTLTTDIVGKPHFEWKLLENIQQGEFIVIDRSSDSLWPKKLVSVPYNRTKGKTRIVPKECDEDLAFILGSLIAEGSITPIKLEFCNSDKEWINLFQTSWKKVFPDSRLHIFNKKPSSYGKKEYYRLECHCRSTLEFLRGCGLNPVKSNKKRVPHIILQSPKHVVQAFLKGYFEGDGTITSSSRMIELGCCSKSETLINELQIFLLRFGIDATKRYDKHKSIWKLYLRGYRNVLRFYKEIGFLSDYKSKKLEYVVYSYKKDSSLTDYVPFISDYIRSKTNNKFVNSHNFDRYGSMAKNYQKVVSVVFEETQVNYTQMFEYLLNYNYLFDQVVSIEEAGIQQVYSIRVDSDCHSFIANGFINHNTECRLQKISDEMLKDLEKDTVVYADNFDGSLKEPTVLPSKFPNLLINGSSGIAVGMATNIPPHNLKEVNDTIIAFIDNPDISASDLCKTLSGPDFPTGGIILGKQGIMQGYATGNGKVKVRAKTDIEEKGSKKSIIISEIPYMVNKSLMIEQMVHKIKDKTITGISDIRDESDRKGMRIVVMLKQDADENVVVNQLFKHTNMQTTFGMNMLALVDKEPKVLTLKDMVSHFVTHRKTIVIRRTEYDLKKAEEQAHLLEGLLVALKQIDDVVKLIKASQSVQEARNGLMGKFHLSDLQAKAILEMRLQKLTSLEQQKIKQEHEQLLKDIARYKEILGSEKIIMGIIKDELTELSEKFGDERRTEIVEGFEEDIVIEDLIKSEEMVVTISHHGYVKRLPLETYKAQNRGGKGIIGTTKKEEDFVEHLFVANTHDTLLVFTQSGQVHWLKVYQIPEASRQAKGKSIVNLINSSEKVTAFIPIKQFDDKHYLVMATKNGVCKKTVVSAYGRPRQGGIRAINLDDGDSLIDVKLTDGKMQLLIATANGLAVKFDENDVREVGRVSRGVRGIKLKGEDYVIGMVIVKDEDSLLTVTKNGFGKRSKVSDYRLINRGGSGVINIQCSERNGQVVGIKAVEDEDEVMLISQAGIIIRMLCRGISVIGRNTQGVRLMRIGTSDNVAAVAKVVQEE